MKPTIWQHIEVFFHTIYMIARHGLDKAERLINQASRYERDRERYMKYGHTPGCARTMAYQDKCCTCPEGKK